MNVAYVLIILFSYTNVSTHGVRNVHIYIDMKMYNLSTNNPTKRYNYTKRRKNLNSTNIDIGTQTYTHTQKIDKKMNKFLQSMTQFGVNTTT